MKFQEEFKYAFASVVIIILIYIVFALAFSTTLQFLLSALSLVMGLVLVILGFWGADFAFAMASGHLNQEKERGRVKGSKGKVYAPFMKNYTPLEWWNINWFITLVGVILVILGSLGLGMIFGTYVFRP